MENTDSVNVPLPGVNVTQKGTSNYVQSNFDGKFLIKIPSIDFENGVQLVFQYIGMTDVTLMLSKKEQQSLKVEMTQNEIWMGEAVIIKTRKKNIFHRIGKIFKK